MVCQQEYAERNSSERDNTPMCSLQMPAEPVGKGSLGFLGEQQWLDPSSAAQLGSHWLPTCWNIWRAALLLLEIFIQGTPRAVCGQ